MAANDEVQHVSFDQPHRSYSNTVAQKALDAFNACKVRDLAILRAWA